MLEDMLNNSMGVFPLEEKEKKKNYCLFCLVKRREGGPCFHWNYSLDIIDTLRFYWNNIVYAKNNKKRNTIYDTRFIYFSFQRCNS